MPVHRIKSRPAAVFFDWDGTLVDSYGFLNDAHGYVLSRLGLPPFREGEYREYFGMPRETLYPKIYKDKCEEAKALFEEYVFANSHKVKAITGAHDLLDALAEAGIPCGVVSNKKGVYIKKEAGHLGWGDAFCAVVGAGEAANDKPSTAPLTYAIEAAGLSEIAPQDIWFVGDTHIDLECAQGFGCVSLFVEGHKDSAEFIRTYNPDCVVSDCEEIRKILVAL